MAEIKKISTELQLLDKFLDTSGDAGTSGQVLTSTGTGINWVSGGSLPGGPYLPLSAGSSYPLTGDLYIAKASNRGELFFGTANANYKVFGGGYFGYMGYNTNGYHRFLIQGAEIMRIHSNSNVGIGSTVPNAKLEVTGDLEDNWAGRFENTNSGGYGILAKIAGTSANETIFEARVGSSAKMLITGEGNVGIGTTSPDQKLQVQGNIRIPNQGKIVFGSGGATPTDYLELYDVNASGSLLKLVQDTNTRFVVQGVTGNVGIGVTSPGGKLEVDGQYGDLKIGDPSIGTRITYYDTTRILMNSANIKFYTNSLTERMRINSNGNVTIGGTTSNRRLRVVDDGQANGTQNITAEFANQTSGATSSAIYIGASSGTDWLIGKNIYGVSSQSYFQIGNQSGSTPAVTVAVDNNVGIGTPSPARKLHVSEAGNGNIALFTNTTDADLNINLTSGVTMLTPSTALLAFGTSSSERMRIIGNGNVGIGTTSPSQKLQVDGSIKVNVNGFFGPGGTGTTDGILSIDGGSGTGGEAYLRLMRGGTSGFILNHTATAIQVRATANIPMFFYTNDTIGIKLNANSTVSFPEYGAGYLKSDASGNITAAGASQVGPFLPLAGGTMNSGATIGMTGSLTIDGGGSSTDVLKLKGSARIQIENANATDSFYISNTGGNLASTLDLGGTLSIIEGGASTFAGDVTLLEDLYATNQNLKFHAGGTHVMNIDVNGKVYPSTHNAYDLGHSTTLAWRNIYSSGTIYGTNATFAGNVGIGTTSPSSKLTIDAPVGNFANGTNAISLNYDGGSSPGDIGGGIVFSQKWWSGSAGQQVTGGIYGIKNAANGTYGGGLAFYTQPSSAADMAQRMIIDTNGNVGIGTTSANFKLDIVNAAASTATYMQFRNGTTGTASSDGTVMGIDADGDFLINNQEAKDIKLYTNDSQRMTISSAGDVGIGKTTSLQSHKLSILKGASNQQLGLYYDETHLAAIGAKSTGDLQIYAWNGSSYRNILLGVDGGAVGGSVGIGTITPGTINGTAFSSVGLHTKYSTLGRTITEGTSWGEYIMNHSGASANQKAKFIQSKAGNFNLGSYDDNGSQRVHMTVLNSGNVGIGTTSPSEKLEVQDGNIKIETLDNTDTKLILNPYSSALGTTYQWELVGTNSGNSYNFQIRENGTPYVTIDSSVNGNDGYVGIGTASPANKLVVSTSTAGDYAVLINNTHSTTGYGLLARTASTGTSAYALAARAGSSDIFVVRADGNVGIGMTSPGEKLSLPDNAKIGLGDSADLQLFHNSTNSVISNGTGHLYIKTTVADKDIIFEASNGAGSVESYFYLDSDQQDVKFDKRIEMTGTGSAGGQHTIEFNPGTSAIGYIYHDDTNFNVRAVKASSDLVLEATHGNVQILNGNGSGTEVGVMIEQYIAHVGDTDTKFGFTAANQFQVIAGGNTNLNVQGNGVDLSYAGSTRLTTQTGGIAITGDLTVTTDVGIGLTNPDVPLHVTANEDGSGIDKGTAKFINTNTGQGATTMHMVQTSSSNFANAVKFWQGSTPTAVGFIRLTTSATQFITSASDLNLKKNITNWSDDTLSKFKALEPKKFRFKTQDVSEDKTLGFIAQNEVDNFPEAYPQFLGEDEKPYYGFNPTGMVPHLMKAIKDLVEKVETLENKITQLENNN